MLQFCKKTYIRGLTLSEINVAYELSILSFSHSIRRAAYQQVQILQRIKKSPKVLIIMSKTSTHQNKWQKRVQCTQASMNVFIWDF